MNKSILYAAAIVIAVAAVAYRVPAGWIVAGSQPDKYDMGTDPGVGINGGNAATIRSLKRNISGFGTLMQNISPDNYKGKRIRLSGSIKADDVEGWSGLWLRVDGLKEARLIKTSVSTESGSKDVTQKISSNETLTTLAFDNMYNRPVRGTTGWTKCVIVLDVPDSATNIAFGALLHGTGQIWFDNLKFDTVAKDVPTTSNTDKKPTNLDFEK